MAFRASAEVVAAPSATPKRASSRLQSERASSSRAELPTRALVYVSPRTFRRAWFVIVLAHSLCAAFVICVGITYLHLRHCVVMEALMLYEVAVDGQYFPQVSIMYFSLASIHIWFLWDILSRSMYSRTYSLRRASVTTDPNSPSPDQPRAVYRRAMLQIKTDANATFQICGSFLPRVISAALGSIWSAAMACYAAIDVRDENYGLFFLFRELAQTSLQTYQAYRLSCLVPRVWMNNVIVTLLVLNCWSTPLVRYAFPANVGKLRLGCALVSVLLDFVSHVAIPMAIAWPYLLQFDYATGGFGVSSWYTDVWLTQAINELQPLFVTSFWDALSKFLIGSSVARWLYAITKLIRVAPLPVLINGSSMAHSAASVVPGPTARELPSERSATQLHRSFSWKTRIENGGHHLLLVWGVAVLVTHLYAASLPVYPQCLLRTRPWFGTKPSCLLLGYDCALEKTSGSKQELDSFLQTFDPDRIGYLVIRRCPLLGIPPFVQNLGQLRGLKLYNSTILSWDSHAALTNTHHPHLLFVFLVEVNMMSLPQGLQAADFPNKLMDVEVVRSNISKLPDSLASSWPKGMFLVLESCNFQEVPSVLPILKPSFLSLALNNISRISRQLLDPVSPAILFFDGNPIEMLPGNLTRTPRATWLSLIATQLASLPDWIDQRYLAEAMVLAGNTPLCSRVTDSGLTSEAKQVFQAEITGLDCYSLSTEDLGDLGFFPIGDEELHNPSYTLV